MKDEIFAKPINKQFEFDESVASVFDDMLSRSVPFYKEIVQLSTQIASSYITSPDTVVYDLGCSTGTTLIHLAKKLSCEAHLIGVDTSKAMLQRASKKADAFGVDIDFVCDDITTTQLHSSKVMMSHFTLQFIRPLQREKLIQRIYNSLQEDGIFIFSEKVITDESFLNKLLIDNYYDFKKEQGYSEYEIAQKREALENVLIPYTEAENKKMIANAGFAHCEILFRWLNFACFIAIKK